MAQGHRKSCFIIFLILTEQKQSFADVLKIDVLKDFANFKGKHLYRSLLQDRKPATLLKGGRKTGNFTMKFAKY